MFLGRHVIMSSKMFATFLRLNPKSQPGWRGVNVVLACIGIVALSVIKIGVSDPHEFPTWAYLTTVSLLAVLGITQFFWQPQTQLKNQLYLWLYHGVLIFATLTVN